MSDWKQRLSADAAGLRPRTLVEIYGRERVLVEQHRGIRAYSDECICIGTAFGSILVEGAELRLCCMSRQQVVVRGRIDAVRTEEGS